MSCERTEESESTSTSSWSSSASSVWRALSFLRSVSVGRDLPTTFSLKVSFLEGAVAVRVCATIVVDVDRGSERDVIGNGKVSLGGQRVQFRARPKSLAGRSLICSESDYLPCVCRSVVKHSRSVQ